MNKTTKKDSNNINTVPMSLKMTTKTYQITTKLNNKPINTTTINIEFNKGQNQFLITKAKNNEVRILTLDFMIARMAL